MHSILRNLAIGASSIVFAPAGMLPPPAFRITIPQGTATEALGHDFGMIGRDFVRAIERVEMADQLELKLSDQE
jgi:hypothetical protein